MSEGKLKKQIRNNLRGNLTTKPLGNKQPWVDINREVKLILDEAKADFPFTLWQSNPEHITYFPKVKKGQNSDSVFGLGTSFLENAEALQKIAEWFVKWFGASP